MMIFPLKLYQIRLRGWETETAVEKNWNWGRVELMKDEHDSRKDKLKGGAGAQTGVQGRKGWWI